MSFLDYVDRAADLAKKGLTIELQEMAVELRQQGVQLQEENVKLKLKVLGLEERIRTLEEALKLKGQLKWEPPVYWLVREDGSRDGPYCQRCWDVENQLVRLQNIRDRWRCHQCFTIDPRTSYYKKG